MIRSGTPRSKALVALVAVTVVLGLSACQPLPPAPPGGTAPDCSDVAWSSTDETAARLVRSPVVDARAGQHRCFDRFVIDVRSSPAPGWFVSYRPVREPATGDAVPVRGGASLQVIAQAPAHDDRVPTYDPPVPAEAVDVSGFRTLRQVAYAGDFEGQTTFGLGVRARLPYRVFALEGSDGARLVVDVAHTWS